MLLDLEFDTTFASTGRRISGKHQFERGMTAISGSNEAGKSLRLEMVRFALFGTEALRAEKSQYLNLSATLSFRLKGKVYKVKRTLNSAHLTQGVEDVAKSHTAVSAAIIRLFGYGLLVFDTAHCIKQGDVEALGRMKPSERKKMVDQTIGLDVIDSLIKTVTEDAGQYRREAEVLSAALARPVEPVRPESYQDPSKLREAVQRLRGEATRVSFLEGFLASLGDLPEPMPPAEVITGPSSAELEEYQRDRAAKVALKDKLETQLSMLKPMVKTQAEIDALDIELAAWMGWQQHEEWEKNHPAPQYNLGELQMMQDDWNTIGHINNLQAEIDRLKAKGATVQCPECSHEFSTEYEEIAELENQIRRASPLPSTPPLSYRETERMILQWERREGGNPFSQFSSMDKPSWLDQINDWKLGIKDEAFRATLPTIPTIPPDLTSDLEWTRRVERAIEIFEQRHQKWERDWQAKREAEDEIETIRNQHPIHLIDQLQEQLQEAEVYDALLLRYNSDLEKYREISAQVDEMIKKADNCVAARDGLRQVKVRVKQHLVPSLNAVASRLLSKMTDGQRTTIEVDEDFNIVVDGQPLHTLSGSGAAAANLAVRIGLGQVLTSRVFPVIMGDEIDASMDAVRAAATVAAFSSLGSYLDQMILVSHKQVEADHYIEV